MKESVLRNYIRKIVSEMQSEMSKITFKNYIAKQGLRPVRIWKNANGMYASIKNYTTNPNGFTQILQGGTVVRLSNKDANNPLIVGKGVEVIFENKNGHRIKEIIRNLIEEIENEQELDEANTTTNIDGYQTPYAFDDGSDKNKKKKKEISTQLGYQLMDADLDLTEGRINRWHEIRKEATQNPSRKLARGLREIKWQLREMGKFLNWYNRVKEMNELSSQTYLKTTHRDVTEIKDRLRVIQQEIQKLGSL